MRTTLTLDADVVRLLEDEVHRTRRPFKQVVNDAIRRGLAPGRPMIAKPYKVKAHVAKLAPGIDHTRYNTLVDELEDDAILAKVAQATRAAERKR